MSSRTTLGIIIVCLLAVSMGASPALGQTTGDTQSLIQTLLARIAELTRQMNALREGPTIINSFTPEQTVPGVSGRHRICAVLNRNLSQGANGDDVQALQEFLREETFFTGEPTGFFGPMTFEALRRWQAAQGFETAGIVGPKSRDRIKFWCGGVARFSAMPLIGKAPLMVNFKAHAGGFTPYRYAIDFGDGTYPQEVRCPENPQLPDVCGGPASLDHIYQQNGIYTAILWQFRAGGSVMDQDRIALGREVIRVGDAACTKEYQPVCASKPITCITTPCNPIQQTYSNRCMMAADGATLLYAGECRADVDPSADRRCKQWFDGCNTCSRQTAGGVIACTLRFCEVPGPKYCTAYFETDATNKSPVISEFSGPTTLNVNQTGTWIVKASDPENQVLTYRVTWGDELLAVSPFLSSAERGAVVQTTTFTHVYSSPGTYTVRIVAVDNVGNEARSSITVQVNNASTACTLEYAPVCGRPAGCKSCAEMGYGTGVCPAICMQKEPQTYGNRCALNAVGATFVSEGECRTQTACTEEYAPVCGLPVYTCPLNASCQQPVPITYSNRCTLDRAGSTLLYTGQCQSGGGACTADAMQCPDGSYVGRTGSNCQFVCPASTVSSHVQCTTPWGNIPVAHNATIPQQPYFTNGSSGTYTVSLMRCNAGSWLRCDNQGNNCVTN